MSKVSLKCCKRVGDALLQRVGDALPSISVLRGPADVLADFLGDVHADVLAE